MKTVNKPVQNIISWSDRRRCRKTHLNILLKTTDAISAKISQMQVLKIKEVNGEVIEG